MKTEIESIQFAFFYMQWKKRQTNDYKNLRLGQAFHQYFDLQKSTQFKDDYDALYQLDGEQAEKRIQQLFIIR